MAPVDRGCGEDRDHVQGRHRQRRLPDAADTVEEHPDRELPGLGQGLRRRATRSSAAVRRAAIIPSGNTNYSLVGVTPAQCKTLKVTGDCAPYNAKTGLGVPNVNSQIDKCVKLIDQAAPDVLREPRQVHDDERRSVGPVPQLVRDADHELERHALRVRSVHGHAGVREHRGKVTNRTERSPGRRQAPRRRLSSTNDLLHPRRAAWTIAVVLAVVRSRSSSSSCSRTGIRRSGSAGRRRRPSASS